MPRKNGAYASEKSMLTRPGGGSATLAAAIVLAAINLRPAISSIGPLLDPLRAELGLTNSAAALLTTIPALCMGVFAPFAPGLAARFGRDRVIAASLAAVGLATAARAVAPTGDILLGLTLLVGSAIGLVSALMGAFVKAHFPARAALMMGAYASCLGLGASIAAFFSAPVATLADNWRWGAGLWAVLAIPALLLWIPLAASRTGDQAGKRSSLSWLWREGRTWRVGLFLGLQNLLFYGVLAWLAALLMERGATAIAAGAQLSLFTVVSVFANISIGAAAGHGPDRRLWLTGSSLLALAGLAGLMLGAFDMASLLIAATGLAGAFTLGLTLPLDDAADPIEAGARTTTALTIGYMVGATGPLIVGLLRDVTGSLAAGFGVLGALAAAMLSLSLTLGPHTGALERKS